MPVVDAVVDDPGNRTPRLAAASSSHVAGEGGAPSLIESVMKAFAAETTDPVQTVARLKREDAEAKGKKKVLARQLKNARRMTARLKDKAKLLSNEDLVQLLVLRGKRACADKDEIDADPGAGVIASAGSGSSGSQTVDRDRSADVVEPGEMESADCREP